LFSPVTDFRSPVEQQEERMSAALAAKSPSDFPIFKTITLGTYKTSDEYRKALKSAGVCFGRDTDYILGKTPCSQQEAELDLVALSVADLGFKDITLEQLEHDLWSDSL
jgi:hypothetical protein